MRIFFENLQKLGRALMLPIAVLPVAGLLLRFGQPDLLDLPVVAAAGAAIFDNLGLLFAVGIAVGLARENHGAAGLAALVGYFVAMEGAATLLAVPVAELAGLTATPATSPWRHSGIGNSPSSRCRRASCPASLPAGFTTGTRRSACPITSLSSAAAASCR